MSFVGSCKRSGSWIQCDETIWCSIGWWDCLHNYEVVKHNVFFFFFAIQASGVYECLRVSHIAYANDLRKRSFSLVTIFFSWTSLIMCCIFFFVIVVAVTVGSIANQLLFTHNSSKWHDVEVIWTAHIDMIHSTQTLADDARYWLQWRLCYCDCPTTNLLRIFKRTYLIHDNDNHSISSHLKTYEYKGIFCLPIETINRRLLLPSEHVVISIRFFFVSLFVS